MKIDFYVLIEIGQLKLDKGKYRRYSKLLWKSFSF